MKVDGYAKCVLTLIAVLLGVIAMNSSRGIGKAYAAPEAGADPFAHYQVTNFRDGDSNLHLLIVDNRTDKLYDHVCISGDLKAEGGSVHSMIPGRVP
jgi:hypothetical protein